MALPLDIPNRPAYAVGAMLLATAFIAATTLLAKALGTNALGEPLHPFQVSHGRFLFAAIAIGLVALVLRPKIIEPNLRLHIIRCVFGWAGVSLMFAAAARIPLSDATAISFLNPVFAMMLAIPLLGEKVGPWRWAAAGIALVGALVLLRPGPDSFQVAALLALGAAMMMGVEVICIKRLARMEGPFQILIINNAIGLCIATVAVLAVWQPPNPAQWGALAALGVLMACAQTCFLQAMRFADATLTLPMTYATLVFAALYDAWLFGVIPDAVSVLGAAIIVSGAALLAWREALRRAPRPSTDTQS
ncbi:MAG: drug/metabolite transporter (DMT)-like permease [Sulfitobacter sp.]|jgi:drug/metabolite transporter (DMT)-like permease